MKRVECHVYGGAGKHTVSKPTASLWFDRTKADAMYAANRAVRAYDGPVPSSEWSRLIAVARQAEMACWSARPKQEDAGK